MSFFVFLKKKRVQLSEEDCKWNKMWELWSREKAEPPYTQLMKYHSEVNNGGHDQYFTNVENIMDLQNEVAVLETILPKNHKNNLSKALKAYYILKEKEDEHAQEVLEQCDDVFYEREEELISIMKAYAAKLEL